MPVLANARHERFSQELAKGLTADAAYEAAGFKPNRGNAARLKANEHVSMRVAELQGDMAERTVEKAAKTRTDVVTELAKIGFVDVKDDAVKASDKRAALLNLAQIEGWVVERHEHTGKDGGPIRHDMSVYSDEHLAQLATILGTATHARRGAGGDTPTGGEEKR